MSISLATSAFSLAILLSGTAALAQQTAPAPDPAAPAATAPSPGVRIVRLSEVNGVALMDRGNAQQFEPAFANLPITQGARLRTDEGTAEVEFEDGSSLRLTPNTLVDFPTLAMHSDGTRVSTVRVVQGSIYASLIKGKSNNLTIHFGDESLALGPSAHIALTVSPGTPRLDVLDGTVQATRGATTQLVPHKKGLVFDPANPTPTLVSKREEGVLDNWDKRSVEYHSRFANSSQLSNSSYQYGMADLNYYGSFMGGSCGGMWRPYLVSSNWSPYDNGVWAMYPGAGYSWVSPYPWGWAPYHSGSWNYCPGAGWGWSPNNQWNGLQNVPLAMNAPENSPIGTKQLRPPHAPVPAGNRTLVPVNAQPMVVSTINEKNDKFLFKTNSAGLGVPRGVFGKLNGVSNNALQHGTAARTVFLPAPSSPGQMNASRQGPPSPMAQSSVQMSNHPTQGTMSAPHSGGGSIGGSHTAPSGGMMGGGAMGGGASMGGGAGHANPGGHH